MRNKLAAAIFLAILFVIIPLALRVGSPEGLDVPRIKELCRTKDLCTRYAMSRQECATAGNFDLCLNVKMGDDVANISGCTNQGKLKSEPPDMPGWLTCLEARIATAMTR